MKATDIPNQAKLPYHRSPSLVSNRFVSKHTPRPLVVAKFPEILFAYCAGQQPARRFQQLRLVHGERRKMPLPEAATPPSVSDPVARASRNLSKPQPTSIV
ncbi:MAG: hypothetical protein ACYC35_18990 [Pirellulales bacterium]